MLLYIHGFNSGTQSPKARSTRDLFSTHYPNLELCMPQLPFCPDESIELLSRIIEEAYSRNKTVHFMGSSLGAYYAMYLRERYGGKAILINPAVDAPHVLKKFVGYHQNPYTGEEIEVSLAHAEQLRQYQTKVITRLDQYSVYLQTADEVLDYKKAMWQFQGCHMRVEQGGSHAFDGFERYFEEFTNFLNLT